jgi:hypothetical protein
MILFQSGLTTFSVASEEHSEAGLCPYRCVSFMRTTDEVITVACICMFTVGAGQLPVSLCSHCCYFLQSATAIRWIGHPGNLNSGVLS